MSLIDSLRKGFNFILLVTGVSAPAKEPQPVAKPTTTPEPRKP